MSYKITITETRQVRKTLGKEWAVIGEKEVERDEQLIREASDPKTRIETIRGYTPEVETLVNETRDVLVQTIDDLDLPAVIRAVNKL